MDKISIIIFSFILLFVFIMFFSLYSIYPIKDDYGINKIGGVRGMVTILGDAEESVDKYNVSEGYSNFNTVSYKKGPISNFKY